MKKAPKTNGPAIDSSELIIAMDELEKEKGIKKDYLLEAIETALVTAYKRNFDSAENVKITMDKETGEIHVYAEKDVVEKPEEVENNKLQICLEKKTYIAICLIYCNTIYRFIVTIYFISYIIYFTIIDNLIFF